MALSFPASPFILTLKMKGPGLVEGQAFKVVAFFKD